MKFDELDTRMRVFETAHDHCVLPELYMVARLDGRGFTRLTKEVHDLSVGVLLNFEPSIIDYAPGVLGFQRELLRAASEDPPPVVG